MDKTLGNTMKSTDKEKIFDLVTWGEKDTFKLIREESSCSQVWWESTKAMYISGVGCVIQVTHKQATGVSVALTFVPNVKIAETKDEQGNVISRSIVRMVVSDHN